MFWSHIAQLERSQGLNKKKNKHKKKTHLALLPYKQLEMARLPVKRIFFYYDKHVWKLMWGLSRNIQVVSQVLKRSSPFSKQHPLVSFVFFTCLHLKRLSTINRKLIASQFSVGLLIDESTYCLQCSDANYSLQYSSACFTDVTHLSPPCWNYISLTLLSLEATIS